MCSKVSVYDVCFFVAKIKPLEHKVMQLSKYTTVPQILFNSGGYSHVSSFSAIQQIWPGEVLEAGEQIREIGLDNCPPGAYLLEMKGENWAHRQKVVVH